eukprot:TRINITY_DN910_c1_g1_i2.p1 TRINITY_DN910_c1_g1~~TRINITY_DN910_c1_g1_i2.p1  ORF type:complete len:161 (-),score=28.76 TRINITY_DN910_c1_g1_i2:28-510(-)
MDECFIHHTINISEFGKRNIEYEIKLKYRMYKENKANPIYKDKTSSIKFDFSKIQTNFEHIYVEELFSKKDKRSLCYKMTFDTPYGTGSDSKEKEELWEKMLDFFFPDDCVSQLQAIKYYATEFVSSVYDSGLEWWGVYCFSIYCPKRNLIYVLTASETD